MDLQVTPGTIALSMLATDFEKGLELLLEIVENPRFDEKEIEKVREQILAKIKSFWDNPQQIAGLLVSQEVYKGHPYSKNILGTEESIKKITKKDLIEFHKKYFSPADARLAIVGDLGSYQLDKILEKTIGAWKGPKVEDIEFPALSPIKACEKIHPINRDQAVLCFAGLSVERKNRDFDKLLLFDQIFGGGALGSMHSKLFQLREQSGLFYTIGGTLVSGANEQPGMVIVKTIVSLDRLAEAEKAIKEVITKSVDEITPEELLEAKRALNSSMVNNFATNAGTATMFLAIDRFGFPVNYFDTRAQTLAAVTLDQVKEAVKKVLRNEALFTLKVGRIEKKNE
jgi:zinc protease